MDEQRLAMADSRSEIDLDRDLFRALKQGQLRIVRALVEAGDLVDQVDPENLMDPVQADTMDCTPLPYAVQWEHLNVARCLLDEGVDVNYPRDQDDTSSALLLASGRDHRVLLELLLERGATPEMTSDREARVLALDAVPLSGHTGGVELPRQSGAEQEREDDHGIRPPQAAPSHRHAEHVQALHRHKIILDATDTFKQTSLATACFDGQRNVVSIPAEAGADVNHVEFWELTPLMGAAMANGRDITTLLLEDGADVRVFDADGKTALHTACERREDNDDHVVSDLIEAGSNANQGDGNGQSAIFYILSKDRLFKTVKLLVRAGSDLTTSHIAVRGPLHALGKDSQQQSVKDAIEVTKLLIRAGAEIDIMANTEGDTTLMNAVRNSKHEQVSCLLQAGATVSSELHVAVLEGDKRVVHAFCQHGASPAMRPSANGRFISLSYLGFSNNTAPPLTLALACFHSDIAKYFASNLFFHPTDLQSLSKWRILRDSNIFCEGSIEPMDRVLASLTRNTFSLQTLSFCVISFAIGFDRSRKERVLACGLPPVWQKKLLFQYSRTLDVPVDQWGLIDIDCL